MGRIADGCGVWVWVCVCGWQRAPIHKPGPPSYAGAPPVAASTKSGSIYNAPLSKTSPRERDPLKVGQTSHCPPQPSVRQGS